MKWGIRRTPEQLGHKRVAKNNKTDIIKTTISGHNSSPIRSKPNSITDHIGRNGRVDKSGNLISNTRRELNQKERRENGDML